MKTLHYSAYVVGFMTLFMSCASDDDNYVPLPSQNILENRIIELYGSKDALIQPLATDFNLIPNDANNPITAAKVELGKFLFHETGLATNPSMDEGMHTYSCASCHHAQAGFQSGILQGIGEGGMGFGINGEGRFKNGMYLETDLDVQPIRTPSALNVAYQDVMLWNGQFGGTGTNQGTEANWTVGTPKEVNNLGFEGVEIQAIAGLDVHRLVIDEAFILSSDYKDMFDEAFPDVDVSERYTKVNAGLAIAAYERTLLPNQAPFQQWLNGNTSALNEQETEGALLFFDEAKCYSCHSGPALNGMDFYALGLNDLAGENVLTPIDDATRRGRGGFTGNSEDDFKFKTPQLYNLKDVAFFGHGGSLHSIEEVVRYKNNAVAENQDVPATQLSPLFEPLNLSDDEIDAITAFLENALYDSNLQRYVPDALPTGYCFPNADTMSSQDMGCD
ncbi:cytochrome-c peroxidase [Psychroserpens algicola]|uniref:Cytochrome-c peroxidase n=1 Tax=Psychroserpens algicola TaxID=1719034 RepID=A0ABT0HC32_9FLAO|nr:cytochrome c peroxidase [Psychroserpens algicola]MCK8481918.1 cytochrome-c peroxidase [Psychroserpens algicola]